MRPVNLIPPEERQRRARRRCERPARLHRRRRPRRRAARRHRCSSSTDNQISDSKAEVAQLKREDAAAEAKRSELAAYTQFHDVREQRVATVTSLADSRFDWERVMRELALILPDDVWLTNLTATASPGRRASDGRRRASACAARSPARRSN